MGESGSAWINYGDNKTTGSLSIHISSTVTLSNKPIDYGVRDPVSTFVGREAFLRSIEGAIENCDNITRQIPPNDPDLIFLRTIVIGGESGVGKSEVLRKFLHLTNKNVMWFQGDGKKTLEETLRGFTAAPFSVSQADADEDIEFVLERFIRKYLAKEFIIVFDNIDSVDAIKSYLQMSLSPPSKPPIVLVTTRNPGNWRNSPAKILELDSLNPMECKEFIYKRLESVSDVTNEWMALTKLCRRSPSALKKVVNDILLKLALDEEYTIAEYLERSNDLLNIDVDGSSDVVEGGEYYPHVKWEHS